MHVHVAQSGNGPAVAVLLHGMMGSSESWWKLTPLLIERGYRVLSVDLPGHGSSDRDLELTIPRAAEAVTAAIVAKNAGKPPTVAMGHSFGGLVLAAAAAELKPELAVYVDAPFSSRGGWNLADVVAEYENDRRARTLEGLRASRPDYTAQDRLVEARAAEQFDSESAAAIASAAGGAWPPAAGSIVIRPEPSDYVDSEAAARLTARGVHVRSIPGASHSVWRSHYDEFVAALPEVFG